MIRAQRRTTSIGLGVGVASEPDEDDKEDGADRDDDHLHEETAGIWYGWRMVHGALISVSNLRHINEGPTHRTAALQIRQANLIKMSLSIDSTQNTRTKLRCPNPQRTKSRDSENDVLDLFATKRGFS